jgi:predicted RNase H-like HicB family nuclease/DNA-binding XRE family transcriptional regulator
MRYSAYVHREGTQWLADFPDAPGCQTFADSPDELRTAAQEALEGWLEAHLVDGQVPQRPEDRSEAPVGSELWRVDVSPKLTAALEIRRARHARGWTQKQLAEKLGVSQQQIGKLENPDENPTLGTIEKVAAALGLELQLSFTPTATQRPSAPPAA